MVTEERWYPGTLVLMTLHRTDAGEAVTERSVAVMSPAVPWGNDGWGLQFIPVDDKDARRGSNPVRGWGEQEGICAIPATAFEAQEPGMTGWLLSNTQPDGNEWRC